MNNNKRGKTMNTQWKILILGGVILNLSSCMMNDNEGYTPNYQMYTYDNTPLYSNNFQDDGYKIPNSSNVVVPNSYHVGEYHSPVSFKDRDRTWVSDQNPSGYTIEIAEGDKASEVAQKLYKTPKNDRMAQVKYQSQGKAYYKGVYGTYPDAESAQKALDTLPDDVKQGASVQSWGSVQKNLE